MADAADIANDTTMLLVERGVASIQAALMQEACENCQVCGEQIPLARRQAMKGVRTCVSCQEVLEFCQKTLGIRNRGYGR